MAVRDPAGGFEQASSFHQVSGAALSSIPSRMAIPETICKILSVPIDLSRVPSYHFLYEKERSHYILSHCHHDGNGRIRHNIVLYWPVMIRGLTSAA